MTAMTWLAQWKTFVLPGTILYLYVVRRLRFLRSKNIPSKLGYPNRASCSRMTTEDAWKIHNSLLEYEFPTTISTATFFALFKAYGIPSISSLLCATGQFSSLDTVDKRHVDTSCLLLEAVLNAPASPRGLEAIARINYLHSGYRQNGKITDDDMLYTLSLFALEPSRWVKKYEWRELTVVELCAVGTIWKQLGEALGVKYDLLGGSQEGWKDGMEWLEDLDRWSCEYQDTNMLPADSNKTVAEAQIYHMTWSLSKRWKPVVTQLIEALLEDKLREAMMIPKPPQSYYTFFQRFIAIRKFILLHLMLPAFRPKQRIPTPSSSPGRLHYRKYMIHPWYVKPTLINRFGPSAWRKWLKGVILPGDEGEKYSPQGFLVEDLGPSALKGIGKEQMGAEKKNLIDERVLERGRCPFLVS